MNQAFGLLFDLATSIAFILLISLGLAVIFGMRRIINLAHGEFIMLGAFASLTAVRLNINVWLAILFGALFVGLFGMVLERFLMRRMYTRPAAAMLATWGVSLILIQFVDNIYGSVTEGIPTPVGSFRIGDTSLSGYSAVVIVATVLLTALTALIMFRTPYGLLARAATQNPEMAASLGVNAANVNMWTFTLGAALAGAAGGLLAPVVGVLPTMGQPFVAQAFMAVIVGGPLFLTGTPAAAGLLGGVANVVSNFTTPVIGQAALLAVAIVALRLFPNGLTGTRRL